MLCPRAPDWRQLHRPSTTLEPLRTQARSHRGYNSTSIAEILPVSSVNGNAMSSPTPGPTTTTLTNAYRELVAQELGASDSD